MDHAAKKANLTSFLIGELVPVDKPKHLGAEFAAQFADTSVVAAGLRSLLAGHGADTSVTSRVSTTVVWGRPHGDANVVATRSALIDGLLRS